MVRTSQYRLAVLRRAVAAFAAILLVAAVATWVGPARKAHAASTVGGLISRAEVLARARDWYNRSPRLTYNNTRASNTLVADVDGAHKYGPDCSGMVSMAWHLPPGQYGGRNTGTIDDADISIPIANSALKPGDLLDDTTDGHAVLFEAWQPDHVHFSYYSFGSTPMRHYDGGSGSTEGPLGSFQSGATLASHPAANYRAYRYVNITDATVCPVTVGGSFGLYICAYGLTPWHWADGHDEYFVVGGDSAVWHSWERADGSWTSWSSLGGQVRSGAGIGGPAGSPVLYAMGTDLAEYCRSWTGSGWAAWTSCSNGTAICPTTVGTGRYVCDYKESWYRWPDGHQEYFVIGTDFAVWHNWTHADGTWDGWSSLGGGLRSGVQVVSADPSHPTLKALGTDLGDWCRAWTGSGWAQWAACY